MFDLNPFHLENASLLHFLMLQGTALLAYFIYRERFRQKLSQLVAKRQALEEALEQELILEPEVEEVFSATPGRDDLKEIAGINPKAEAILNSIGVFRFTQLAQTPVTTVRRVLAEHGPLLHTYDPATWPGQALLAADGRWDELRSWQEQMRRGESRDSNPLFLP
ncbi:hypothetical protein [Spirosoma lituiforme]